MKKIINTEKAPAAIGPYSQACKCGNICITSGQLPIDVQTGEFASNEIKGQTKQSLENVVSILAAEGLSMNDVVKTTVFLSDMNHFVPMNEVYSEYFEEGNYPARSAIEVARLPKDALVEIQVMAVKD